MNIEVRGLWVLVGGLWLLATICWLVGNNVALAAGIGAIFLAVITGTMTVMDKVDALRSHWGPLIRELQRRSGE